MNHQIDLFSFNTPLFKIDKPIRLIEMFAGIGSQAMALKKLGANYEHWKVLEIDKHAIDSYNSIFNTNFAPQDITQTHASDLEIIDRESYIYILTYSFPCQDLSLAGKQRGMSKGTSTRSGLLWEVERILDECKGNLPQILVMENVPQVIGKNNIKDFQLWRRKLESLGYSNHVQLLNAKEIGYPEPIPQNRNRCFMVSILGNYHYNFPKKTKLKKKLKDLLDNNVDEKYYLSDKQIQDIQNWNAYEKPLEQLEKTDKNNCSPTITTRTGEYTSSMILVKNNNKKGYAVAEKGDGIDISSRMKHHRGTVQKGMSQTLDTLCNVGVIDEKVSSGGNRE